MPLSASDRKLEIFEAGGTGGVFQHSLELAVRLREIGVAATLHTATDAELADDRVATCRCFNWYRQATWFRPVLIAGHFLLRTVPHMLRCRGRLWIQGTFKIPLTLVAILAFRMCGRSVVFSPHNLFARSRRPLAQTLLDLCLRSAGTVVAYNSADAQVLKERNLDVAALPLFMYAPVPGGSRIRAWQQMLGNGRPLVCAVGQLREDKNLDLLVRAAAQAQVHLAILGEDKGAAAGLREAIASTPGSSASLHEGYWPLEDLAAVLSIADAVALPYSVASQSGVAVLAASYGAVVISADAGGLKEQADVVVGDLTVPAWAAALAGLHAAGRKPGQAARRRTDLEQLACAVERVVQ